MAQDTTSHLPLKSPRIMLYSHDTYGLGHLRRASTLASAITRADPSASALILTGSPVAGRYAFPQRVDHIRLPGVTKQPDGSYVSRSLGMDIDEITNLRSGLIQSSIIHYRPDILIIDKEPTGFRGELLQSLDMLLETGGTRMILGLRDVLDEPSVVATEWERKNAIEATELFYDEVWVYGQQSFFDPTAAIDLSSLTRERVHFTGYLRRSARDPEQRAEFDEPYVLVTPGGGGDGEALVDLVISAYETDPNLKPNALLIYGPFLSGETREKFEARVSALDGRVRTMGFESNIEPVFASAQGVIAMGGYNTFCEVLSFDRPVVIVPRTKPRLEQYIRAARAQELGFATMLDERAGGVSVDAMIAAIRNLPNQKPPSASMPEGILDGLDKVCERVAALLDRRAEILGDQGSNAA